MEKQRKDIGGANGGTGGDAGEGNAQAEALEFKEGDGKPRYGLESGPKAKDKGEISDGPAEGINPLAPSGGGWIGLTYLSTEGDENAPKENAKAEEGGAEPPLEGRDCEESFDPGTPGGGIVDGQGGHLVQRRQAA